MPQMPPTNRAERRAAERAARRKPAGRARDTAAHKLAGACSLLAQIEMCRPSDGTPIPGDTSVLSEYARDKLLQSINNVRAALHRLSEHASDDVYDAVLIHQALGISRVRAVGIAGPGEDNPALPYLDAGREALEAVHERHGRTGRWGFAGPERAAVFDAVDVYEDLMRASSPQQREDAMRGYEREMRASGGGFLPIKGD